MNVLTSKIRLPLSLMVCMYAGQLSVDSDVARGGGEGAAAVFFR